jgi:hypothetical protein
VLPIRHTGFFFFCFLLSFSASRSAFHYTSFHVRRLTQRLVELLRLTYERSGTPLVSIARVRAGRGHKKRAARPRRTAQ